MLDTGTQTLMYANCVYFVIVATEFFTNWNAIEGWGRGDFKVITYVSAKYFAKCATKLFCYMNPI